MGSTLCDTCDKDSRYMALKAENAELRELAKDACTVLRDHYDHEWFDGTMFAERMRELGIEVSWEELVIDG